MSLIFHPMEEANAHTLISWRYDPPYDIYNILASTVEEVSFLTDPHNAYYSLHNEDGILEAFCCFGADAQVPGGDYTADALDVGWGVRPDLTGQG
jgi:[ribosomal protein S18]-alanine N-acetyltransferase